ncbi:hypothetical protein [Streptomyces himalayensis]|uniref:hypothetical protein n=1 Tax=Streptomyces himalayensis TaxID=2820085 RepID=UPI001FECB51C|nr:hypothetical protein [Streptomyces himalayensis]
MAAVPRRSTIAPAFLALAALALAGCGSSSADDRGASEPVATGSVSKITSAKELAFPLDAYELTPQQSRQLDLAQDRLVTQCMSKQGFAWAEPQRPALVEGNRHNRRYGILDEAEARRTGYHGPQQTGTGAKGRETGRDSSDAAQKAAGTCVLEAKAKLNGKKTMDKADTTPDAFVEQLIIQDAERAEQDPQVQKAFAKWSACMDDRGFDYADPWDSNNDPQWGESETATDRERQVAAADASCKIENNLAGVWLAVETAYQQRTIEENAEALAGVKKANEDALRRAADVLGDS